MQSQLERSLVVEGDDRPEAIVLGLDGVLASTTWRAFDPDADMLADSPIPDGLSRARKAREQGRRVIVVEDRDPSLEGLHACEWWLHLHDIPFDAVFAAGAPAADRAGCYRSLIEPAYRVMKVVDHGASRCSEWEALGLDVEAVIDPALAPRKIDLET